MRRSILLVLLVLSLAAGGASWWLLRESSRAPRSAFDKNSRAFLNAQWGMTRQEVEQANHAAVLPVAGNKRFFTDPGSKQGAVYRSYENKAARFLGREAVVTYTFRNDRLLAYHVFVSDSDADVLDADMRRYLLQNFGKGASEPDDDSTLKLIWQSKDRIVNYWLMEEELSLRSKYTAGFGVTRIES